MPTTEKPVSVAEAVEMVATEDSWLNDGVTGVVRSIKQPPANAQKRFWKCVLADAVGSATIDFTLFFVPKFSEGDLIEIVGQGVKRKEYNGRPEIGVGKTSEIHVLGRSVHHDEQVQRAATSQPAINGQKQPIHGQTVGMALKEAIALTSARFPTIDVNDTKFWAQVHRTASTIIRLGNALEHGNLTAPLSGSKPAAPSAPAAPEGGRADPTTARAKPPAGENGQAFPTSGPDEDVPF